MTTSSIVSRNSFAAQRIVAGSRMTQSWASFAPATAARASNMIILRGCPGRDAAAVDGRFDGLAPAFRFGPQARSARCLRRSRAHRRRALAGAGLSENASGVGRRGDRRRPARPRRLPSR